VRTEKITGGFVLSSVAYMVAEKGQAAKPRAEGKTRPTEKTDEGKRPMQRPARPGITKAASAKHSRSDHNKKNSITTVTYIITY